MDSLAVVRDDQAGSPGATLQLLLRSRLDETLEFLGPHEGSLKFRVHESRKNLKRLRAGLRLLAHVSELSTRQQRFACRDAARMLSGRRDQDAARDTLVSLARSKDGKAVKAELRELADAIAAPADEDIVLAEPIRLLTAVREEAAKWPLCDAGTDELHQVLAQSSRRGRKALKKVRKDDSAEHIHELRKRVKAELYQVELVAQAENHKPGKHHAGLKKLASMLGDCQDLAMVGELLESRDLGSAAVHGCIDRARHRLAKRCLGFAESVYAKDGR